MDIKITLSVDEPSDIDENDGTGLTEEAFNRLMEAIGNEGFSIVSGPVKA